MRALKNSKITVFGSFAADLTARVPRLPVPGETRASSDFRMGPGGKGFNQCVAAWKAGADATMVCKIGRDAFGRIVLDTMKELGMPAGCVICDPDAQTGNALIMVDEETGENLIAVTLGANAAITGKEVADMTPVLAGCGILLVQLEVNLDALERAVDTARGAGAVVALNCAPVRSFSPALYEKIDIITPNETEARALTGIEIRSERDARRAADWFMDRGVEAVVITLGEHGVFAADLKAGRMIPAVPVRAVDTTGAGDAFNGNFAACLASGMDLWESAAYANAAAALSVTRIGAASAMPGRREVEALLRDRQRMQ